MSFDGASSEPVPSETALVFPGQGSQEPGMRDVVERFRPELIALARTEMGDLPFTRADDGTQFAQPAIFCASLAEYTRWKLSEEPAPGFMAGHSVGEIVALVAADSIAVEDGLRLVALRGRLMQEACERTRGGMVAVLGSGSDDAPRLAADFGLTVANDNCPGQLVLSGSDDDLDSFGEEIARQGLRTKRLNVAGAFHSPAMRSAAPAFAAALAEVDIREPRIPVMCGATAEPFADVRRQLVEGLTQPVRWRQTVERLHRLGVRRFVEVGPGKVLTGLVKRTLREAPRRGERAKGAPAHA
jgi:[acyl-carrier-protein] S-malonyltransferase